jgi:PST family polysaccharide transporter
MLAAKHRARRGFDRIFSMKFLKTSALSFLSTAVKIVVGFFLNKIIALYVGPAGMSVLGQLQNFVNITQITAQGGITPGTVKYIAEYHDNEPAKRAIAGSSVMIVCAFSLVTAIVIVLLSNRFSLLIFENPTYSYWLIIYALLIFFPALNALFLAILNGEKLITKYLFINVWGSVVGAFLSYFMIRFWYFEGAVGATIVSQCVLFFVSLPFLYRHSWCSLNIVWYANKQSILKLAKFSAMTVVSTVCVNLSEIVIRNSIVSGLSLDWAGYWQAMSKLSLINFGFITTSIGVYYLPRLSEIVDKKEFIDEIVKCAKIILPTMLLVNAGIYLWRESIVCIVFAESFLPMTELFAWQMVGDFFKIASWLISFAMIAKAVTNLFIVLEIVFSLLYVGISVIFIRMFGFIGLSYAWAILYVLFFLTMLVFLKIFLNRHGENV